MIRMFLIFFCGVLKSFKAYVFLFIWAMIIIAGLQLCFASTPLHAEGPWNGKACAFTFSSDDGNDDNMEWKVIFDDFGYHFTIFVVTRQIGNQGKLIIDDLNVLQQAGHEIASHSVTHRHLIRNTAFTIQYVGQADSCRMKIADYILYLDSSENSEDYILPLTDSAYKYLIDLVNYIDSLPVYTSTLDYYPQRVWSCESKYLVETEGIDIKKGILDIIETANLIPNSLECRFLLAGKIQKKDDFNESKNLINKYNLENKVNIIAQITEETKIELFKQASIFLLPSYTENLPLVAIEAAAAGLPIIATPVGGLPEFFKHNESIIFVEPGDVNQIANAIEDLFNDETKRERLGKAAREVFLTKLSRSEIMSSLDKIYQHVLLEE